MKIILIKNFLNRQIAKKNLKNNSKTIKNIIYRLKFIFKLLNYIT